LDGKLKMVEAGCGPGALYYHHQLDSRGENLFTVTVWKSWRKCCLRIFWTISIANRGPKWNDRCWTGRLVYLVWLSGWAIVWRLFWDSKTVLVMRIGYDMNIWNKFSWLIVQIDSRKHKFPFLKNWCVICNFYRFEFIAICEPYLTFYNLGAVPQYIVAARWPQKSLSMNILLCNLQFSGIITMARYEPSLVQICYISWWNIQIIRISIYRLFHLCVLSERQHNRNDRLLTRCSTYHAYPDVAYKLFLTYCFYG